MFSLLSFTNARSLIVVAAYMMPVLKRWGFNIKLFEDLVSSPHKHSSAPVFVSSSNLLPNDLHIALLSQGTAIADILSLPKRAAT
jgi:hypothetical protein